MTKRANSRLRNKLLALFLLVVCLMLMATPDAVPNSSACRRQEHDIFYYTDATYTVQCGYKVYPCSGNVRQGGCVTEFYIDEWYDC